MLYLVTKCGIPSQEPPIFWNVTKHFRSRFNVAASMKFCLAILTKLMCSYSTDYLLSSIEVICVPAWFLILEWKKHEVIGGWLSLDLDGEVMEGVEMKYASQCYMTGVLYTQFILFSELFKRIFLFIWQKGKVKLKNLGLAARMEARIKLRHLPPKLFLFPLCCIAFLQALKTWAGSTGPAF